jgi:hypothetical protein
LGVAVVVFRKKKEREKKYFNLITINGHGKNNPAESFFLNIKRVHI